MRPCSRIRHIPIRSLSANRLLSFTIKSDVRETAGHRRRPGTTCSALGSSGLGHLDLRPGTAFRSRESRTCKPRSLPDCPRMTATNLVVPTERDGLPGLISPELREREPSGTPHLGTCSPRSPARKWPGRQAPRATRLQFHRLARSCDSLVSPPSASRVRDSSPNSRAGHPASRRCSSLTYSRYARSSRLAIRAPRPGLRQRISDSGH